MTEVSVHLIDFNLFEALLYPYNWLITALTNVEIIGT